MKKKTKKKTKYKQSNYSRGRTIEYAVRDLILRDNKDCIVIRSSRSQSPADLVVLFKGGCGAMTVLVQVKSSGFPSVICPAMKELEPLATLQREVIVIYKERTRWRIYRYSLNRLWTLLVPTKELSYCGENLDTHKEFRRKGYKLVEAYVDEY